MRDGSADAISIDSSPPDFSGVDQARAPHDGIVVAEPSPEVGKVDRVKRFSLREADRLEIWFRQRRRQRGQSKLRVRAAGEPGERKRERIGGEQNLAGVNLLRRIRPGFEAEFDIPAPADALDAPVLENHGSEFFRGLCQRAQQLAGIERPAGNFAGDTQSPGIVPVHRRVRQPSLARDLPCSGKREITVDAELCEDARKAFQNIAQAGKVAGSRLPQRHSACAPTCAVADAPGLDDDHGFTRVENAEPCRRGQTGETRSDNGKVGFGSERLGGGNKANFPRWHAPRVAR